MIPVYISIGNSDDKLSQASAFIASRIGHPLASRYASSVRLAQSRT